MQGYNHVAGGLVFTGIFASFHDVNVLSSPGLTGATVAASLLPDIDHTRSAIGKTFYPVASWLQRRYGHRTITHSVFFYLAVVGLMWLTPKPYTVVTGYALLSHLLFDMCTKQGVPLLYPFSKRPFVLPANPGLRLSAQDHRSEAIVFVVFLIMGSFCRPLFAQGFWTSYNQAFATWEHVERESRRSPDLLHVTYGGPNQSPREGLFYRKNGSHLVVLTTGGFDLVDHHEQPLIRFEHSGFQLLERQRTVSGLSPDSLNRLLTSHCVRVQIQSTDELIWFTGTLMHTGKAIDLNYQKNLLIHRLPHDDSEIQNRIALARLARSDEQNRYNRDIRSYRDELQRISTLETRLRQLADEFPRASDYRKGEIIHQRAEAERKLETARQSQPLPPLVLNLIRYDLDIQLLEKQLRHPSTINANLITVSWKPRTKNS